MAPPRDVQSSTTNTSSFPIDKLPPELLHMICAYLKPIEVANLRLQSRLSAAVGTQYLAPEFHLVCSEERFRQLDAIARHSVASKHVTSLFYEADRLRIMARDEWESCITGPEYIARLRQAYQDKPSESASDRDVRIYRRELTKARTSQSHSYNHQQLDEAFQKYLKFIEFQKTKYMLESNDTEIDRAMFGFPKLKEVLMCTELGLFDFGYPPSEVAERKFRPGFSSVFEIDGLGRPIGVQPMRSLLLGLQKSGIKLESFQAGFVNWRIFQQSNTIFSKMQESLSGLRKLNLMVSTGVRHEDDEEADNETEECAWYLRNGRLKDLVSAAPNLEHLGICFAFDQPDSPTDLRHVVGDHRWPCLKTVRFDAISMRQDDWINFYKRHKDTLKRVQFGTISLLEYSWWPLFEEMRKTLFLDSMLFDGTLRSFDDEMDFYIEARYDDFQLKVNIEDYLEGMGEDRELSLDDYLDAHITDEYDGFSDTDSDMDRLSTDLGG